MSFAVALAILVLAVRMAVPQGWMPARAPGQIITLCTGVDGMTNAWVDEEGRLHKLPDGERHEKTDSPCAFGGMAMTGTLPDLGADFIQPADNIARPPAQQSTVSIGRGLAAPPPPATGPPLLI